MTLWHGTRIFLTTFFGFFNILAFSDWRFSKKKSVVCTLITAAVMAEGIFLMTVHAKSFLEAQWVLFLVLQLGVVLGAAFLLGKHNGFRTLFSAVIALVFNQIGAVITLSIATVVETEWLLCLLYAAVYAALNAGVFFIVRGMLLKLMRDSRAKWGSLFLLGLSFYLTLILIVPLPSGSPGGAFNSAAGLLLSLSILWVFLFMRKELDSSEKRNLAAESRRVMEYEVKKLESQIALMEENEQKLAILRHDLKHNCRMLSELLAEKDYDGCRDMLGALDASTAELARDAERTRFCRNRFLNSVLTSYAELFEIYGVGFRSELNIEETEREIFRELAVVIGNCLENALNAVRRLSEIDPSALPEVSLKFYPAGEQMFLEIVNPYASEVKFDDTGRIPVTQVSGHGVGTLSVKSFADKYDASVSYTAEGGMFSVRIIL